MVSAFDRVVIAVPDLDRAVSQYHQLTGVEPVSGSTPDGIANAWLGLPNTVIELRQRDVDRASIQALVLRGSPAEQTDKALSNPLQLELYCCDGQATADFRRDNPRACSDGFKVDHLVLRTDNAEACVELFAGKLGIRLALDRTVPQWGGRMLFFRAGQLTLEVIESGRDDNMGNYFWGIAFQCADIATTVTRMRDQGITLSDIREGRKPGTRVVTVKSHCLDIPTLLVQPAI